MKRILIWLFITTLLTCCGQSKMTGDGPDEIFPNKTESAPQPRVGNEVSNGDNDIGTFTLIAQNLLDSLETMVSGGTQQLLPSLSQIAVYRQVLTGRLEPMPAHIKNEFGQRPHVKYYPARHSDNPFNQPVLFIDTNEIRKRMDRGDEVRPIILHGLLIAAGERDSNCFHAALILLRAGLIDEGKVAPFLVQQDPKYFAGLFHNSSGQTLSIRIAEQDFDRVVLHVTLTHDKRTIWDGQFTYWGLVKDIAQIVFYGIEQKKKIMFPTTDDIYLSDIDDPLAVPEIFSRTKQ